MPRKTFLLDRSVTHRLHTLGKLTDRETQRAYLLEAGLALGEGRCLAAIGAFGPLSVNELAGYANLNKGQASRAAQTLVQLGLVLKEVSPLDARGVVLSLSVSGTRRWRQLEALIARRNAEITDCLTVQERQTLDLLLDRLVSSAKVRDVAARRDEGDDS